MQLIELLYDASFGSVRYEFVNLCATMTSHLPKSVSGRKNNI